MKLRLTRTFLLAAFFAAPIFAVAQDAGQPPAAAATLEKRAESDAVFVPFDGGVDPAAVTNAMINETIVVTGTVVKYEASAGERVPYRLTLHEAGEAAFEIVYWPDIVDRVHGAGGAQPFVGQKVSAKGKIGEYKGKLQIRVSNPKTLRLQGFNGTEVAASAEGAPAAAGDAAKSGGSGVLSVSDAFAKAPGNDLIVVDGEVAAYRASWSERAPNVLKLSDGNGELDAVFFTNENITTTTEVLVTGAKVRVVGKRSDYQGKTQLRLAPGREIALQGSEAAKSMSAPADVASQSGGMASVDRVVNSADLDAGMVGKAVTVAGVVEGVVAATEGKFAVVRDRDGIVAVFIDPKLDSDSTLMARLANGTQVKIKGNVEFSTLRSQLVVVPSDPNSITVAKSAAPH